MEEREERNIPEEVHKQPEGSRAAENNESLINIEETFGHESTEQSTAREDLEDPSDYEEDISLTDIFH